MFSCVETGGGSQDRHVLGREPFAITDTRPVFQVFVQEQNCHGALVGSKRHLDDLRLKIRLIVRK